MDDTLTMDVRGQTVPVTVEPSGTGRYAQFVAKLGDRTFRGETWTELLKKLTEEARRSAKKIAVPFASADTGRNGTVYSVHAGSGNLMVEWADGSKEQLTHYRGGNEHLRPLTDDERAELVKLKKAERDAAAALRSFKADRRIDLTALVDEALKES